VPNNNAEVPRDCESLHPEKAYSLASRLTLIPGFPNRNEAIAAASEWLLDHCKSLAQAEWLVEEAIRHFGSPWSGLWELESLYSAKFRPAPAMRTFEPLGPKPKVACSRCNDWGTVLGPAGVYTWCTCDHAHEVATSVPNFLAVLNHSAHPAEVKGGI
jgi:hypothetical protein